MEIWFKINATLLLCTAASIFFRKVDYSIASTAEAVMFAVCFVSWFFYFLVSIWL